MNTHTCLAIQIDQSTVLFPQCLVVRVPNTDHTIAFSLLSSQPTIHN